MDGVIECAFAYPCDENGENTSEREERPSTGDRFAFIEEYLEGRAEEREVDPWRRRKKKKDVISGAMWGGRGRREGKGSVP